MENDVLTVFEIDLDENVQMKTRILNSAGMGSKEARALNLPTVHRIAADVTSHDWVGLLLRYGFSPDRPCCVVAEGLLYYMDPAVVLAVLETVRQVAAPGSRIGFNTVSEAAASGSKFKSGHNDPEQLVDKMGWEAAYVRELGDPDIAHGWSMQHVAPRGPAPREDKTAKRTWYITCTVPPGPEPNQPLKQKLRGLWVRVRPAAHWAGRMVIKAFTTGFQLRIPLPDFLNPHV